MPVSPDTGNKHAGPVADMVTKLELDMLETAAAALRAGLDRDGWETAALARINAWRAQVQAGVPGALQQLQEAVRVALAGAAADGAAVALVDLPEIPAVPPISERGLYLSETRLGSTLARALAQAPRILEGVLRQAVRAGAEEVRAGDRTRRQGAQQVLDRLVRQGITGFRDSAGRNWSLSSYTEMAVRTEVQAQALAAGDAAIRETGLDLIIVSDSPRECPLCRPFEGKILSLDGAPGEESHSVKTTDELTGKPTSVRVMTSLSTARSQGFQHPNCTHSYSGYIPGVTTSDNAQENPDGYEQKQRQRYMERKIREFKRAEVLALDEAAAKRARAKVREWQTSLREYVADNDLKRQPGRESITRAI